MKLNFKEKYLIILVVLCFIILGFYYSYAIFVTKQLQENVLMVKVDNNYIDLLIDNDNKITIEANTVKDFKISLSNNYNKNYYYLVMVKGLIEGVKVSSNDNVTGEILSNSKKDIMIHVNNTSMNTITLEFIVKVNNEFSFDKDLNYYYINTSDNYDHSGANIPKLNKGMIPVSYKKISDTDGYWYKTDINNQIDLWYSYENGLWANAIYVKNYDKYQNSQVGEIIDNSDILDFYVWIPRFKYYIINSNNYTNYERMVNIIFEEDNGNTGTVECIDDISDKHVYSEICTDNKYDRIYDNLSTYTHPSFKDKTGFWVSKFLIGSNERSLPNVTILRKNIMEANKISNRNNSHVLTNMEYGAITLLSNSSYGKTNNDLYINNSDYTFTRIYSNTYENNITGCSSDYSIRSKNIITDKSNKCITYNDLTNSSHISNGVNYKIGYIGAGASSTGNITGVYDLVSLRGEMVSAYVGIKDINTKYYDIYSYNDYIGKISSSKNIYNLYRYKLGDGIKEHFRNFGEHGMWHGGVLLQNSNKGFLVRGSESSIYSSSIEDINYIGSFRQVLN